MPGGKKKQISISERLQKSDFKKIEATLKELRSNVRNIEKELKSARDAGKADSSKRASK